jgi:hypothetical protein
MWDAYRHGGKNIMSFHKAMQGVNVARGIALRNVAPVAVAVASMAAQRQVWRGIGSEQQGAVHYSHAGLMSGSSMPIVGGLPTWSDFTDWWGRL